MVREAMNIRFVGALAGVAIAYVIVVLPLDALDIGWLALTDELALIGAPVAAILGWWLTPTAVAGSLRWTLGVGLGVGGLAAPMGALAIAYLAAIQALAGVDGDVASVPAALFIATYGLGFSVIALPVTLPAGVAWSVVVRAVVPEMRGRDPGVTPFGPGELSVILVVVAVGAALVSLGTD
jgi:hypothetical protein